MGVGPEERFEDEEEPEMKGGGDDWSDPTVVDLIEPLDAPIDELGVVGTINGGSDREKEGWSL